MSRADLARRCLQLALVLCLIGLVPGLLAIWGQRRAVADAAWHDPADDVRPEAIAPDLALLSLAGTPDDQLLALAMETGELETTRALLTFSADLTDQQRLHGWLWLAYRYQEIGQIQQSAQAYRLAGSGAILSDPLPDILRTETLLTVGQQLLGLQDKPGAHFYLQQAALISANASHLTKYNRRSLLERLRPALLRAGGERDDWHSLARAVEKGTAPIGDTPFPLSAGQTGWHSATPGNDAALIAAQDARRAAAAAWFTALTSASSVEPSADYDLAAAQHILRQALLAEDAAIDKYLEGSNKAGETDPAAKETRLRWLLLKRRIAAGGAIAGLVPEWEADREEIRNALNAAWNDWLAYYAQGQATHAARRALVAAYWGLYPDAPVADLVPIAQSSSGRLHLIIINQGVPPVVGWSERTD